MPALLFHQFWLHQDCVLNSSTSSPLSVSKLATYANKIMKIHPHCICLKPKALSLSYGAIDCKLRANFFTKLAGYASRRFNHDGRMIPLTIEGIRHVQKTARALSHTQGAALASLLNAVSLLLKICFPTADRTGGSKSQSVVLPANGTLSRRHPFSFLESSVKTHRPMR